MALVIQTNVSVDVYRTANPATPYTLGTQAYSGLRGYLKPAAQNGRYGSALYLKWTHILQLAPGVDIRDAYNGQLDPARDNTKADTVILYDSTNPSTTKTAFYVVFVEQVARGAAAVHLRVYLDRFKPNLWPTNAL